jgi:hypothetical protein
MQTNGHSATVNSKAHTTRSIQETERAQPREARTAPPPIASPPRASGAKTAAASATRPVVPGPPGLALLQEPVCLSQSILWQMIEDYYRQGSLETWARGDASTPYYVTCNAVIADVYAELITAFLSDVYDKLDTRAPIYVVELAAGSGTFSHHLLGELFTRLRTSRHLRGLDLRYVMTDFSENTVVAWESVPSFEPYGEILDSAVFRPESDRALQLRKSGTVIEPASTPNPAIVIANYFFDTIRSDSFHVVNGTLYETLYAVTEDRSKPFEPNRPFVRVATHASYRRASLPYYYEAERDALLGEYGKGQGNAAVSLPIAALNVVDGLRSVFSAGILLLSSDKGFTSQDHVQGMHKFDFAEHGSISFAVNYDAIALYMQRLGAMVLRTVHENASLASIAGVLLPGGATADAAGGALAAAFERRLNAGDALNAMLQLQVPFHIPVEKPKSGREALEMFGAACGLVRSLNHDPSAFCNSAHLLQHSLPYLGDVHRRELLGDLRRIESKVYLGLPVAKRMLLALASLYTQTGAHADAVRVSEQCERLFGGSDELRDQVAEVLVQAYVGAGKHRAALERMQSLRNAIVGENLTEKEVARHAVLSASIAQIEAKLGDSVGGSNGSAEV